MDEVQVSKSELLKSGILELWHNKEFSDFEGNALIRQYCENFVNTIPHKKGILMTGINGVGKTMLMNIMLKNIMQKGEKKSSVFVIPYWELTKQYIKSWRDEGTYDRLKRVQYLGIDDVGKSFETTHNSKELALNALEFLLTYRIQRNKPTIITTNIPVNELRSRYSNDIASKLNEACVIVEFENRNRDKDDFRKSKLSETIWSQKV